MTRTIKTRELITLPKQGNIVYLYVHDTQLHVRAWVKRDIAKGMDLRVSDYGDRQYGIQQFRDYQMSLDEMRNAGYIECDENEFNDVFIEAWSVLNNIVKKTKVLHGKAHNQPAIDPTIGVRRKTKG